MRPAEASPGRLRPAHRRQHGVDRGAAAGRTRTVRRPCPCCPFPRPSPPPVWPWKQGTARGIAFHPLYPSVPEAAERNPTLAELLALFDAVRGGSAREQALALTLLEERLQP